jgi:hypothetical protein
LVQALTAAVVVAVPEMAYDPEEAAAAVVAF